MAGVVVVVPEVGRARNARIISAVSGPPGVHAITPKAPHVHHPPTDKSYIILINNIPILFIRHTHTHTPQSCTLLHKPTIIIIILRLLLSCYVYYKWVSIYTCDKVMRKTALTTDNTADNNIIYYRLIWVERFSSNCFYNSGHSSAALKTREYTIPTRRRMAKTKTVSLSIVSPYSRAVVSEIMFRLKNSFKHPS